MMTLRLLFSFLLGSTLLDAGGLNILHLGPEKDLEFEVKVGREAQKFTLAHRNATGPFLLPDKAGAVRSVEDGTQVKIKGKKTGQIAVIHPEKETFKWRLEDSEPSKGQTTLRVVNLSDQDATLVIGGVVTEIKGDSVLKIEAVKKSPIRISFANRGKLPFHELEEPCAVVAFIYQVEGAWKLFYLNDT